MTNQPCKNKTQKEKKVLFCVHTVLTHSFLSVETLLYAMILLTCLPTSFHKVRIFGRTIKRQLDLVIINIIVIVINKLLLYIFIIHQIFLLVRDWSKRIMWANIPQFLKPMDNKHNSLKAHSFPRALLSENCSLLGTDNVRGQVSEHIFAPNEGYCLRTSLLLH